EQLVMLSATLCAYSRLRPRNGPANNLLARSTMRWLCARLSARLLMSAVLMCPCGTGGMASRNVLQDRSRNRLDQKSRRSRPRRNQIVELTQSLHAVRDHRRRNFNLLAVLHGRA